MDNALKNKLIMSALGSWMSRDEAEEILKMRDEWCHNQLRGSWWLRVSNRLSSNRFIGRFFKDIHERYAIQFPDRVEKLRKAVNSVFAHTMSQPLRRVFDYQSIARKLFQIDPLPNSATLTYNKDIPNEFKK